LVTRGAFHVCSKGPGNMDQFAFHFRFVFPTAQGMTPKRDVCLWHLGVFLKRWQTYLTLESMID